MTAKNEFQIRIVHQKMHNIKEKRPFFDMQLKENITIAFLNKHIGNKKILKLIIFSLPSSPENEVDFRIDHEKIH